MVTFCSLLVPIFTSPKETISGVAATEATTFTVTGTRSFATAVLDVSR
jgi:hypothetical protein